MRKFLEFIIFSRANNLLYILEANILNIDIFFKPFTRNKSIKITSY